MPFDTLKSSPGGVRPPVEPHHVLPAPEGWEQKLHLCPPDIAQELAVLAKVQPQAAPMQLICRRVLNALNGAFRDSKRNRSRLPVNYAYMAAADMADLQLTDDDLVEIRSNHGVLRGVAREDARLRRGVVSMTHMFGPLVGGDDPVADGGSNVGQLTSLTHELQPINFMPLFSGVGVTVRKVEAHRTGALTQTSYRE